MPKAKHLAFLVTERGEPFTAAGFGNWFRDQCDAAGITDLSAHGLRKAGATRLVGATDHEIMAWGGWKTLREVQRYTAAAIASGSRCERRQDQIWNRIVKPCYPV
jgi:integrase